MSMWKAGGCVMALLALLGAGVLLAPPPLQAAPAVVAPQRMRPYTGAGVLLLASSGGDGESAEPLYLYEEPAISRLEELQIVLIPSHEWIFGLSGATLPLIVMAQKGSWLRVVYDDAGREAWLNPRRRGAFQRWDDFFKGRSGRLLTGLQKKYCQLFLQRNKAESISLTPKQVFKMLKLDNDWAMVMLNQNTLGWLRWRDEDGRLLIGLDHVASMKK